MFQLCCKARRTPAAVAHWGRLKGSQKGCAPLRHLLNLVLRQARRHITLFAHGSVGLRPVAAAAGSSGSSGRGWRRALCHKAAQAPEALTADVADQAAVGDLDVNGTCKTHCSLKPGCKVSSLHAAVTTTLPSAHVHKVVRQDMQRAIKRCSVLLQSWQLHAVLYAPLPAIIRRVIRRVRSSMFVTIYTTIPAHSKGVG
jgi:hypothetical protein